MSDAAAAGAPAGDAAPPKFKVTVDGVEKELTAEELTKAYELSAASHERFRAASELNKQAQERVASVNDLLEARTIINELSTKTSLDDEDKEKFKRVCDILGVPGDQMMQVMGLTEAPAAAAPPAQVPPEVAERIKFLEAENAKTRDMRLDLLAQKIESSVKNALDTDPVCGKIMVGGGEPAKKITVYVMRELQRRTNVEGAKMGPELLAEVVKETAGLFGGLATNTPSGAGSEQDELGFFPSLGSAPGGGSRVTRTLEPLKRPSAADARDYEDYIGKSLKRAIQNLEGR